MTSAATGPGVLAAMPLKAFAAAKGRLEGMLEPPARAALSRAVAERVATACARAGAVVAVVTADTSVASWARDLGLEVIAEPPGGGLDGAAAAAAAAAVLRGWAWCIVHADLPLLTPAHVAAVAGAAGPGAAVLAPSRNGGTNLFAATVPLNFAYGPRSFSRHLAAARHLERRVVVTVGTALDLDTPEDLRGAAALPGGAWLRPHLT
ncbi:MAG: 2-phospho-L-lactate guanylyltransferase [Actinomycetota bacterium]